MNRRTALKNLSLSIGYVVSAPTLMNMFSSCTADPILWKPKFLNESEKGTITHLVDIIMPSSDLPGGFDVNVPQFIDIMLNDVETKKNKNLFHKGSENFAKKFESKFNKNIIKASKEEVSQLFEIYFKLSQKDQTKVLQDQNKKENEITANEKGEYLIYKFLFAVRNYSLFGYYTSKEVGEEILNYDPIPGKYESCIPLNEIGNAWSL